MMNAVIMQVHQRMACNCLPNKKAGTPSTRTCTLAIKYPRIKIIPNAGRPSEMVHGAYARTKVQATMIAGTAGTTKNETNILSSTK
jgi:hypothetical protein